MSDKTKEYAGSSEISDEDYDFLKWVWSRLHYVNGDNVDQAFMVRLVHIIERMELDEPTKEPTKEPLGLVPKTLRDADRIIEITQAIERYVTFGKGIPKEWLSELITLVELEVDGWMINIG